LSVCFAAALPTIKSRTRERKLEGGLAWGGELASRNSCKCTLNIFVINKTLLSSLRRHTEVVVVYVKGDVGDGWETCRSYVAGIKLVSLHGVSHYPVLYVKYRTLGSFSEISSAGVGKEQLS